MALDQDTQANGYDAFISYSREDVLFASKLESALQSYRPPKDLDVPQRNLRIFRDETTMVGTELSQAIEDSLRKSRKLIVVCSPSARNSQWVDVEIRRWVTQKGFQSIIPILLKGKANNDATEEEENLKAFPKALYEETYVKEDKIPLATSYVGIDSTQDKVQKGMFEGAWYTLLANIYDVSREEVEQRDRRAQLKKRNVLLALVSVVAVAFFLIAVFAWYQMKETEKQRDIANEKTNLAEIRRLEADHQKQEAERQTVKAETQKAEAEMQRDIAKRQTELAEQRRLEAESQKNEAERQKQEAIRQKRLAVKNADEALQQTQRAKAEAILTETELKIETDPHLAILLLSELQDYPEPGAAVGVARKLINSPQVLTGHTNKVQHAEWSPDGTRLVTTSDDKTARVWTFELSGALAGEPLVLTGHTDYVGDTAWSPDGKKLVTTSGDATVRVWTFDTSGRLIGDPLILYGHTTGSFHAAWSPDGSRLATSGGDGVRIWTFFDSQGVTDQPLRLTDRLTDHTNSVFHVAWSQDGTHLLTSSADATARLWTMYPKGNFKGAFERRPLLLSGHTDAVNQAAWAPDGNHVATVSWDRTVRIWSIKGSQVIHEETLDLKDNPSRENLYAGDTPHVTWSPDGKRLAAVSAETTAHIWAFDPEKGEIGNHLRLTGHTDNVFHAVWSHDGQRLVTVSGDGTVRIWTFEVTGKVVDEPLILTGHTDGVLSAAWSPNGDRLVTASQDKTARVWTFEATGELAGDPLILPGNANNAAWSPDGTRLFTDSWYGPANIWKRDGSGIVASTPFLSLENSHLIFGKWAPNGLHLATTTIREKFARVWTFDSSGNLIGPSLRLSGHTKIGMFAAWAPDSRHLATTSGDRTVRIWNLNEQGAQVGDSLVLTLPSENQSPDRLGWSSDGKRLVTDFGNNAHVWTFNSQGGLVGNRLNLTGHTSSVTNSVWSPVSTRLVTTSHDKTARVWSFNSSGELADGPLVLSGHNEGIGDATWSPNGLRLVTYGWEKMARVWTFYGKSGETLGDPLMLPGNETNVGSVAWAPDSRHLVITSGETAGIWTFGPSGEVAADAAVLQANGHRFMHAAWSPDGTQVVTTNLMDNGRAYIWLVGWEALLKHLRTKTNACLSPLQRVTYLREQPQEAYEKNESCERQYGRM